MTESIFPKKTFSIHYMLKGPNGVLEAPNSENPVECANLESLLAQLSKGLPKMFGGVEVVGVRVEEQV